MSDEVFLAIVIGVPVGAVCAAAFALHFVGSAWLLRISNVAIGIQVAAVIAAFVLPKTMPGEKRADGQVCPDDSGGQGNALIAIALGSIAVGAIALASSSIVVRRRAATQGRLVAGIVAAALVIPIFGRLIGTALCGYS